MIYSTKNRALFRKIPYQIVLKQNGKDICSQRRYNQQKDLFIYRSFQEISRLSKTLDQRLSKFNFVLKNFLLFYCNLFLSSLLAHVCK